LITALANHTRAGRLSRAPIHSSPYVRPDIRAAGTNASHSCTFSTTKANYASTVGSALAKNPGGFIGTDIGAAGTDPSNPLP
jgi:hypothetical protein